ncbi:sigma-54 dependent transcriptional regulator [Emcibacter nanhaiensis]|uniref:Sigma-54-dependent Fis family transcriptional regulator n=1 Tax=Emcibacter nanhaiensis TaxID=1505037 RepID=A0A501PKS5_9PROT|nr:sigma-54 dependent transcriptional regulator [Emcibacter nanhaiensis]TPD60692.1 sigma-54-dependent Fis family transcriptional regulator [Emcibacter nanhaiensis]
MSRKGDECAAVLIDAKAESDELFYSDQKLSRLVNKWPHLRLIALAGKNPVVWERLGYLLRQGLIYDFHSLPADKSRLLYCLGHIQGLVALERNSPLLPLKQTAKGYGHLIGTSAPMQKIYSTINRISRVDSPILITGESGTGKEAIALTIHKHSPFRNRPFVAINCAALPASLIESELFGHEVGAFTGALSRKIGKVELADNGTLFLDEIGDMPIDLQSRFLRFLQNSSFERVGGLKNIKINARIIAATNVNLYDAIENGQFREDLFYRLNVLSFHVPPLRERCEDIRLLADHYLEKFRTTYNKPKLSFTAASYELMNKYAWPGNVRELINAIRRATILAKTRFIQPENLGLGETLEDVRDMASSLAEARADFDRRFIHARLVRNNFNISKAAEELQVSRVSLYRLMKRLDIPKPVNGETVSQGEK